SLTVAARPLLFIDIRALASSTPFPTRRSSDLDISEQTVHQLVELLESTVNCQQEVFVGQVYDSCVYRIGCGNVYSETKLKFATRSEEHTSELQSRFELVCRLLLEKNKIKLK